MCVKKAEPRNGRSQDEEEDEEGEEGGGVGAFDNSSDLRTMRAAKKQMALRPRIFRADLQREVAQLGVTRDDLVTQLKSISSLISRDGTGGTGTFAHGVGRPGITAALPAETAQLTTFGEVGAAYVLFFISFYCMTEYSTFLISTK